MFEQHKFIPLEHKAALQSVISRHQEITAPTLVMLYSQALAALQDGTIAGKTEVALSRLTTETLEVGTATDCKSGFYLQLAHEKGRSKHFLTMGQKWVMEQPAHSTINTVFW